MSARAQRSMLEPYPFETHEIRDPAPSPRTPFPNTDLQRLREYDLIELTPVATVLSPSVIDPSMGYVPRYPETIHTRNTSESYYAPIGHSNNSFIHAEGPVDNLDRYPNSRSSMFTFPQTNQNSQSNRPLHHAFNAYPDPRSHSDEIGTDLETRQTIRAYDRMNIHGNSDCLSQLETPWLNFAILESNGGEFSPEYEMVNMLQDDNTVYCSRLKQNVNIILAHSSPLSAMRAAPFWLDEVCIRVPSTGFTSPLKNGFLFVCSEAVNLKTFDSYDSVDTAHLLCPASEGQERSLPMVPSCVRTVLFFQLDRNSTIFRYRFHSPIKDSRYIFVKLLGAFGSRDNIDVEFVGFQGKDGKLGFPSAGIL